MKFKNEKEFEFNVYKDLESHGIQIDVLEEPFDARIGRKYIEFKMSKWNPKYHHPMISFTRRQTLDMLNGKIPIVLVCGTSSFYLLSRFCYAHSKWVWVFYLLYATFLLLHYLYFIF